MKKNNFPRLFTTLSIVSLLIFNAHVFGQGVAINATNTNADASAILDVSSKNAGVLIPRLDITQRDAILNPAAGLQIFNTECEVLEIYTMSGGWLQVHHSPLRPAMPIPATCTIGETDITWNWNSVSGATGYKYNTVNNYLTATPTADTSYTLSNPIFSAPSHTLYVWAYNSCGASDELNITISGEGCGHNLSFTYNGSTVIYGTVYRGGLCWLDRNLGASRVATSSDDGDAYGDLFQWGRGDDGHQNRISGTTTTLSGSDNPVHANFIKVTASPYNWRSPKNDNLWQGVSGINNPCPSGWRLPTDVDLTNEYISWGTHSSVSAYASTLKWAVAGYRSSASGMLSNEGSNGYLWTSTVSGAYARFLDFCSSYAVIYDGYRGEGFSVRCCRD